MKTLFAVLVISLGGAACDFHSMHAALVAQVHGHDSDEAEKVAGNWEMNLESPHGPMKGPLKIQQDGSKLAATFENDHVGTLRMTGSVQGKKLSLEVAGGDMALKFTGTIDGANMSGTIEPHGGAWTATRQ